MNTVAAIAALAAADRSRNYLLRFQWMPGHTDVLLRQHTKARRLSYFSKLLSIRRSGTSQMTATMT
jgi:hypothetical protein